MRMTRSKEWERGDEATKDDNFGRILMSKWESVNALFCQQA